MTISSEHESGKDAETVDSAHVRLLKALAHPTRLHLLGMLSHREQVSPAEYSRLRLEPVSNVAYHFRALEKLGCIEIVNTRKVRGSTEHYYRRAGGVVFDDDTWLEMPDEARQIVAATIVRDLVGRVTQALQAGTFTARKDVHVTWRPVNLDELGWTEIASVLDVAFNGIAEAEVNAAKRLAKTGEDAMVATVGLLGFESPVERSEGGLDA